MPANQNLSEEIKRNCQTVAKQQLLWRRHFHRFPELSNQEFSTTKKIKEIAKKLGLKILPLKTETGVLAEITGKKKGRTVAVRTDIDALPITEQVTLPFSSENTGRMHACGHDMHMATVLGTAAVLSKMKDELNGTVRFIFQPAEEMPPGGARPMIENGALNDVSMIFGLHVDPQLTTGNISIRDGVTMASVVDFDIIVHGRGGHAARPHLSVDAIATAAEVIESIQKVVSRDINPISPVVITFGQIVGGVARNVIADRVVLTGTARTLSASISKAVPKLIKRTATAVCRGRGARAEMKIIASYPVLSNHSGANRIIAEAFQSVAPRKKIQLTPQGMGGEDFACYLEKVPGAMFRLGIRNKKIGAVKPWHSPLFIADENAMPLGTSVLTSAVLNYLGKNR